MSQREARAARRRRAALGGVLALAACTPVVDLGHNRAVLAVRTPSVVVAQDGRPSALSLDRSGDATSDNLTYTFDPRLSTLGVSGGCPPGAGATISCSLVATPDASPGDYPVTVTATNPTTGATSAPAPFTVTVAIAAHVSGTPDPTLGVDGLLVEQTSTALQPASFQTSIPNMTALAGLHPQHPLIQIYVPPWQDNSGDAGDWHFNLLDAFVVSLFTVDSHGPELQIANPPKLPGTLDQANNFDFSKPTNVDKYAQYCAYLVSYYNKGSFVYGDGGPTIPNPNWPATIVTWWGILSDFNSSDMTAAAYPGIYNEAVAAMLAVDKTIQISALEFGDNASNTPGDYLPDFLAPPSLGGVDTHVDALSLHMYATDRQGTTDLALFQAVPALAQDVTSVRTTQQMQRPELMTPPIWITQTNVNSNVPNDAGLSQSTHVPFENDLRGTNAFFAAWAPYAFSQLGQHGAALFSHWDYTAGHEPVDGSLDLDPQNAEVNYNDGSKFLSYWVDWALAQTYPPNENPEILPAPTTEKAGTNGPSVDVLVTRQPSTGIVVVMVEDIAATEADDAGLSPGLPRTVVVDLSVPLAGQAFSGSLLTVDSRTDAAAGPTPTPVDIPATLRVPIALQGYGVAFLTLTPHAP